MDRLSQKFQGRLTALRPNWRQERGLVAFSGGLDSTALLHLAARSLPPEQLAAAHLNHQLRGAAAEADQASARQTSEALGLKFFTENQDVTALARERGLGTEEAARAARYDFLRRAAATWPADFILTGHQADDQAETVLWRLIKGAGAGGLAGIPPRRRLDLAESFDARSTSVAHPATAGEAAGNSGPGPSAPSSPVEILRPLLTCPRSELREWLANRGLTWVEDASNQDPRYLRNLLRGELWPRLTALNPRLVEALGRTALVLRDEEDYWRDLTGRHWREIASEESPDRVSLNRQALLSLSRAERRRLIYMALRRVQRARPRPGEPVGFESVETVLALLPLTRHRGLDLPGGLRVEVEPGAIRFSPASRLAGGAGGGGQR